MVNIDLTFLRTFTKEDPEKIKKYIGMFLRIAPEAIQQMETYLATQDYDALKVNAHSLKPQISYMGIKELEQTIKEIEYQAGSKSNVDQLPDKIASFKSGCEEAYILLKAEVEKININ